MRLSSFWNTGRVGVKNTPITYHIALQNHLFERLNKQGKARLRKRRKTFEGG
jgi:hypothetical protein